MCQLSVNNPRAACFVLLQQADLHDFQKPLTKILIQPTRSLLTAALKLIQTAYNLNLNNLNTNMHSTHTEEETKHFSV